jgi:predicted alpha/beta hydrolase family esterase
MEITILVHGLATTERTMCYLQTGLQAAGITTLAPRLPTYDGSLEDCVRALDTQLAAITPAPAKLNFVAHSMGGLIVRTWLKTVHPCNVDKCVFIATPHRGTILANIALAVPTSLGRKTKGLKCLLTSKENKFLLDNETGVTIGVIAGTGWYLPWFFAKPFFGVHRNDGKVPLYSARSADAKETIVLPYGHDQILQRPETLHLVQSFIETGSFYSA